MLFKFSCEASNELGVGNALSRTIELLKHLREKLLPVELLGDRVKNEESKKGEKSE